MKTKVPVTIRALTQRINRKLTTERLVSARGASEIAEFGRYYTASGRKGSIFVHEQNVDPEAFARKLGVLADWEELATR